MTMQEAYERMRIYLGRPGARQADDGYGCAYEITMQEDGAVHRCAVGCLLSVEAIQQLEDKMALEGVSAEEIMRWSLPRRDLRGVSIEFLQEAQSAHDDNDNWRGGKFKLAKLDELAAKYGLTAVVDEVVSLDEGAPREVAQRELVGA